MRGDSESEDNIVCAAGLCTIDLVKYVIYVYLLSKLKLKALLGLKKALGKEEKKLIIPFL